MPVSPPPSYSVEEDKKSRRRLDYEYDNASPPRVTIGQQSAYTPRQGNLSGFENLSDFESSQGSDRKKRRTDPPTSFVEIATSQSSTRPVHRIPPIHHHVPVTGSDGTRVYLLIGPPKNATKKAWRDGLSSKGLLDRPIATILEQVETQIINDTIEESNRLDREFRKALDESAAATNDFEGIKKKEKRVQNKLWVDKYAPRHYGELLSDESTNRECLKWLKAWDHCVFGTKIEPLGQKEGVNPNTLWEYRKIMGPENEQDPTGRPFRKVMLIAGPPGLGKTTLAHTIAKHCGYRPVEMNASDDRTPEVFKIRILAATEMQNVDMTDNKPNCLVIDEIDGANAPAIEMLVNLITAENSRPKKGEEEVGEATEKAKKKGPRPLNRPIICICNDQYVPHLRTLRAISHILYMNPTSVQRLSARLSYICKREKLLADSRSLAAVCELTDNDVRASLNCLQFLRRKTKALTVDLVNTSRVGLKDKSASLLAVLEVVFHRPLKSHVPFYQRRKNAQIDESKAMAQTQSEKVVTLIQQNQEYDKIIKGCFQHYPTMRIIDPEMRPYVAALDWLLFYDFLDGHRLSQHHQAMSYMPYAILAFHHHCAVPTKSKIQPYGNAQYQIDQKSNIYKGVLSQLSNRHTVLRSQSVLSLELAPYLAYISSPDIRPVTAELLNIREKRQLNDLINLFVSYNLTYTPRQIDGQYIYHLTPDILDLVILDESNSNIKSRFNKISESTKQYIAHQAKLEALKRSVEGKMSRKDRKNNHISHTISQDKSASSAIALPPMEPQPIKYPEPIIKPGKLKTNKDFFARFRTVPDPKVVAKQPKAIQSNLDISETPLVEATPITHENDLLWYKYNQGFTNAVRRPIKMRDLMY